MTKPRIVDLFCGADGWSCRVADWREAMGIDWMTREEIKQAIPPAYTEYIGQYLMGCEGIVQDTTNPQSEKEALSLGTIEKTTNLWRFKVFSRKLYMPPSLTDNRTPADNAEEGGVFFVAHRPYTSHLGGVIGGMK